MTEGLVGLAAFLALALLRVPMAFAMGIVGFFGFAYKVNFAAASAMIAQTTYETGLAYTLSVIPLFILMGNFVVRARMSEELYHAAYTFLGHRRGGLAMSTIVASAAFGSICGSSIATAATFAKVAYPSMRKFGYKDTLAAGSIAAGGTLGILIPPSVIMVIYGIMTETNIGKLFIAGILPGLVATALLCLAVSWITWRDPQAGPPGEKSPWSARLEALKRVWPVLALFIVVIGGIYGGVFTATEGAGIGAGGAFVFALARRALTWKALVEVLVESVRTTSMLFMILIGALVFANFINYTTMPADLRGFVVASDHGRRGDLRDLHRPRHGDGGVVDDPAHRAAVLPGGDRARLRPDMVRHHHRDRGADRAGEPARGNEHLRGEEPAAARHHGNHVPRRDAVQLRAGRAAGDRRRLPRAVDVPAEVHEVRPIEVLFPPVSSVRRLSRGQP